MQFKLDRCSTGFFCPVSINSSDIVLQFDTGAVNTVISASALGYDEYEVERLQYYARTSSKCSKMFKSASGNDIFAYLCYSENVCIDDKVFSKFYYFLCLDSLKDSKGNPYHILLLGLDFITCCGLTCSIGGSFYVKSFSDSKYEKYFNKFPSSGCLSSLECDRICSLDSNERSISIMTNKEKIQANWENPSNYKPCRRKQYEAYVCMPPKGTVVIDKFVQHDAYRMMNGQAFFTVEQRSKNTGIVQRLNQLMQSGRVMVVSDNEPFVVVGASGEFYTCSAQVLQKKFRFLQNGQPVMINDVALRQRMKNGVLDWSVIRFIPDSKEILSACYVPTAMKGQIQTFTGLMSINDPSMQHGKGDFIVAPVGQNRMPNFTMRIVVNGTVFADTYDIRGWEGCLGAGTTARINTNTLPRLI